MQNKTLMKVSELVFPILFMFLLIIIIIFSRKLESEREREIDLSSAALLSGWLQQPGLGCLR